MSEPTPTREQLLALQPGESLRHGWMSAVRPSDDPTRDPLLPGIESLYFKKRYLEGALAIATPRDQVEDVALDPWELMSLELDGEAASQGMHSREDASPVVDPWA